MFAIPAQNPVRDVPKGVGLNQATTAVPQTSRWETLAQALNKGQPVTIRNRNGNSETYWMRPRLAVSENFQLTIGNARGNKLPAKPKVYEGYRFQEHPSGNPSPTPENRAFFAIVGDSFAAIINDSEGNIREITTDQQTGQLEQRIRPGQEAPYSCWMDPRTRIAAVSTTDPTILTQNNPSEVVEIIPPVLAQGGEDPATGNYSKIIDTIPSKRLVQSEEIAEMVLYLVSKKASYINGATLSINGGLWMD